MRRVTKLTAFLVLAAIAVGSLLHTNRHQHSASHPCAPASPSQTDREPSHLHVHRHGDGPAHSHASNPDQPASDPSPTTVHDHAAPVTFATATQPHMHINLLWWDVVVELPNTTDVPYQEHFQSVRKTPASIQDEVPAAREQASSRNNLAWQPAYNAADSLRQFMVPLVAKEQHSAPEITSRLADDSLSIAGQRLAPPLPPPRPV